MDQAIKIHCGLVNLEEALVIEVFGVRRVAAQDHLHGLVEARDAFFEAVEIEGILDVVKFDLDEELVALKVTKPLNPTAVAATLRIKHFSIFS